MNSFSSASQTCEPLPRTINRGSPPTERNARTGEFTPPGIMLSARNWRRRDCSVLCDVVDSIDSSRHGEMRCQRIGPVQPNTIAVPLEPISSDIHGSVIPLQHRDSTLDSSSRPSNREGFEGQSRGLRAVLFLFSLRPSLGILQLTTINLPSYNPSHDHRLQGGLPQVDPRSGKRGRRGNLCATGRPVEGFAAGGNHGAAPPEERRSGESRGRGRSTPDCDGTQDCPQTDSAASSDRTNALRTF